MSGHDGDQTAKPNDRGSATIWAVSGIAVLCLVAAVVVVCGAVVQTRHRTTAAADLAALAAAGYTPYGAPAACARANWVAEHMRAHVTSCRLSGWDALVEVSATLPGTLSGFGPVTAHSRAGPTDP